MDVIQIHEQTRLSFNRTIKITLIGIRYRLFRSAVTVVVVSVAIAFLMNILSESLIKKSIATGTQARVKELRQAAKWVARLSIPETDDDVMQSLGTASEQDPLYQEAKSMGSFTYGEMQRFQEELRQATKYLRFFEELDYGRRRLLIRNARGLRIFDKLKEPAGYSRFRESLKEMKSVRFPGTEEEFKKFLSRYDKFRGWVHQVQQGRSAAMAKARRAMGHRSVLAALADAGGRFGASLRSSGYVLFQESGKVVAQQARELLDMKSLERTINDKEMRRSVAGYLDVLPEDVNIRTLWDIIESRKGAQWYLDELEKNQVSVGKMDVERVLELAALHGEKQMLARTEGLMEELDKGVFGLGERMTWLVLASMLVCVVGISNAMLMSVTERFREIATLKCLGALDGFIMLMFVLEASFLGVVGGILGAILGILIGIGRMTITFDGLVATTSFSDLFLAMIFSVVLGVILASLAAVYPSLKAAQLAPMEAMRIE